MGDGVSLKLSPRYIVTGLDVEYNKHFKLEFGEHLHLQASFITLPYVIFEEFTKSLGNSTYSALRIFHGNRG